MRLTSVNHVGHHILCASSSRNILEINILFWNWWHKEKDSKNICSNKDDEQEEQQDESAGQDQEESVDKKELTEDESQTDEEEVNEEQQ